MKTQLIDPLQKGGYADLESGESAPRNREAAAAAAEVLRAPEIEEEGGETGGEKREEEGRNPSSPSSTPALTEAGEDGAVTRGGSGGDEESRSPASCEWEDGELCDVTEDHYITTHEIQLSELSDHDGDREPGAGSSAASWDAEEESQLCPFADYAERGGLLDEPEIRLSIRTTSRAINDPGSIREEEEILYHARRAGDVSRYVLRGAEGQAQSQFGGRRRGREVTGCSSGTSSAVSELDDADKEVRSLTARAFKSLAYPYFEALSFSTSSESSASERGLGINRWSTFLDLKYGNVSMEQSGNPAASSSRDGQIFTLNANPRGAASSQQIQLMGKFGQGRGGVIRLTETLNFRCNVKSGMSGEERRSSAAGSRSLQDGVTRSLQGGQQKLRPKTMEDTHKKAIFATSLIKNVLSKKMQFEQERRMERGEISEPRRAASPPEPDGGRRGSRELERQSSRFSESGSDFALMCAEELGDFADGGSCGSRRRDACAPATETNLNSADEAGIDTKKGALLRSQNSAFRCWKDEELGFQKDHKSHQTLADDKDGGRDPTAAGCAKLTKMSHLFVPSIHLLPGAAEPGSSKASRSPEIKINLRSVADSSAEPIGVSKPRRALAAALKAESSEKVPHFTVRDIRDSKGKLQTPIHQVRDVRKLVKSSYHFVSLDKNENKSALFSPEGHSEQKKPTHHKNPSSVSPMVIKCQSVNTNNAENSAGKPPDACRSSPDSAEAGPARPEPAAETGEPRAASQVALEKLQAAVKTMEQLYVLDKNEWKRKSEPQPQPLTDSHVLPLIAGEEQLDPGDRAGTGPRTDRTPSGDGSLRWLEKELLRRTSEERPGSSRLSGCSAAARAHPAPQAHGKTQLAPKSPKMVRSSGREDAGPRAAEPAELQLPGGDNENYLTIPVNPKPTDQTPGRTLSHRSQPSPPAGRGLEERAPRGQEDHGQRTERSSVVMETHSPEIPAATIYHSLPMGVSASQPQVYCFSPAVTPAPLDPFQATQRKMLLDPTTGSYYLVDTPLSPASRRLFDPETGQYVDVPVPQPPMTPVPMPLSPLALGTGAYGHAYMIYPGFLPAPSVIPARTLVPSQLPAEAESGPKAEGMYLESPFYMATGRSGQPAPGATRRPQQGFSSVTQPVISISSQQGPRIIAPPSFDGTTMSFVVEHR